MIVMASFVRTTTGQRFAVEPQRRVPVAADVDVVVAGSGISGMFAALRCGRAGLRTLLIDRLGALGGNMGPGMVVGGSFAGEADVTLIGGLHGIPGELLERVAARRVDPVGADAQPARFNYAEDVLLVSAVASEMMAEAGVSLLLGTTVADPIVGSADGGEPRVAGLFTENKNGRQAVRARVVIDATGDAAVAARAGCPMIREVAPNPAWADSKIVRPGSNEGDALHNNMGIYLLINGIDWSAGGDALNRTGINARLPQQQRAHVDGGGAVTVRASAGRRMDGVLGVSITLEGAIDSGDSNHVTQAETLMRRFALECAERLRRSAPGCERCYALHLSPVVGARGGPCIDGEYTLTVEDHERGARFDDVLFVNVHEGRPPHAGAVEGCDVPYRCLLPQGVDNLLVVGRGAAYVRRGHDPTGMRARPLVMVLGQAAGVAAELAIESDTRVKRVNRRELQRRLLADGFHLGDSARLHELGLS